MVTGERAAVSDAADEQMKTGEQDAASEWETAGAWPEDGVVMMADAIIPLGEWVTFVDVRNASYAPALEGDTGLSAILQSFRVRFLGDAGVGGRAVNKSAGGVVRVKSSTGVPTGVSARS